jgi:hypothetical protein
MPFADQLLEQARHLANREKTRPRQASLRRAVSTAYYALFHLLISEATSNWKRADQRHALARAFDHGKMRSASDRQNSKLVSLLKATHVAGPDIEILRHLQNEPTRSLSPNTSGTSRTMTTPPSGPERRFWNRSMTSPMLSKAGRRSAKNPPRKLILYPSWGGIANHNNCLCLTAS